MKKRFFILFISVVCIGGFWLDGKYTVPVIMYHNIRNVEGQHANTVSSASFTKQMDFLKSWGYRVISVEEYIKLKKEGKRFSRRSVVITFDDGYEDNYTYAFPVLKKHGFPAMEFIAPENVGKPGFVSWPQVVHMDKDNFRIGSHTMTHAYLPDLQSDEGRVWYELYQSKADLELHLGRSIDYFAYPIGGFSDKIKNLVKKAGYKAAFATNRGYDRHNQDLFEINRIRMKDDDNTIELLVKLSGYYNLLRTAKKPY